MRIFLIPGFGEDELIFSKIAPLIPGEHVILNSWKLLGDEPRKGFNAIQFAHEFIAKYNVTKRDVLIGHSMGGWIAHHVKHFIQCPVIHISSMTNTDRIILPVCDSAILYWAIKSGLVFNSFTQWLSPIISYHDKRSKEMVLYLTELLKKGNTENIVNQLKVILKPVKETITTQPDLRIHAKKDTILKPPREPYYPVEGDHFSLYTHPNEVSVPIVDFLAKLTG